MPQVNSLPQSAADKAKLLTALAAFLALTERFQGSRSSRLRKEFIEEAVNLAASFQYLLERYELKLIPLPKEKIEGLFDEFDQIRISESIQTERGPLPANTPGVIMAVNKKKDTYEVIFPTVGREYAPTAFLKSYQLRHYK